VLTAAVEVALAKQIEAGLYAEHVAGDSRFDPTALAEVMRQGREAWELFFESNLGMALLVASRWSRWYRTELDDVFQECCLGLGEAIMRWDWARGNRFSTIAWHYVTNYARQICLVRNGRIDAPPWVVFHWNRLQSGQEASMGKDGANRSATWVQYLVDWRPPQSLDDLESVDVPAGQSAGAGVASAWLWGALNRLDRAHRYLLVRRFGLAGKHVSGRILAGEAGLSINRLREIEQDALDALRETLLTM
jgi:DNA-directed RNA polymerase sigma subunit (sigma70/sigma32)